MRNAELGHGYSLVAALTGIDPHREAIGGRANPQSAIHIPQLDWGDRMKYTFTGKSGRAQLTVFDSDGKALKPRFRVRLLPRGANRSTAYATAGDQAYLGADIEMALLHIRAWTGIVTIELPASLKRFDSQGAEVAAL